MGRKRTRLESGRKKGHVSLAGIEVAMRELVAFLIAPIPAAALGGLLLWGGNSIALLIWLAASCLLLLYAAQLIVGAAVWAFLRRTGRCSATSFVIGGTVMTGLSAIAYMAWAIFGAGVQFSGQEKEGANLLLASLVLGGITGLCFWQLTRATRLLETSPAGN